MTEPIQIELPTIFEAMTVNSWLIKGEENILIDCGEKTDATWDALNKGLEKNGLTLQDISKVVITHAHLDHMGMANRIAANSNAKIWVSEMVYDWATNLEELLGRRSDAIHAAILPNLSKVDYDKVHDFGYKRLSPYWDEIPVDKLHVFPMEGPIDFGGQTWEIIHTPGHCLNQTCFYQKDTGWLLSADMILPMIPIPIVDAARTAPYEGGKSLMTHLTSYEKLLPLNITKAFPGHFDILEDVPNLIENQKMRIGHRKEKCFRLIESGSSSFMELLEGIYKERINNATIFMVIGFLNILESEGRIKREMMEEKWAYFANEVTIDAL